MALLLQSLLLVVAGCPAGGAAGEALGVQEQQLPGAQVWAKAKIDGGFPLTKLPADNPSVTPQFARALAVSGNFAVVGKPNDNDRGLYTGAAYVYELTGPKTWTLRQELIPTDKTQTSSFGTSVAISGDSAVVGTEDGYAYVFVRNGNIWSQQAKLAKPGVAGDCFGCAVAISGNLALIGAYQESAAYLFARTGASWTQLSKLSPNAEQNASQFGLSVALDGSTAVVGAPLDTQHGLSSGKVYVFDPQGTQWVAQELSGSDETAGDSFGSAVSISKDTIAVGARLKNLHGEAYVFARQPGGFQEQQKLVAPDARSGDNFGSSVSVQGSTVAVGAPYVDDLWLNAIDAGAVYIFANQGAGWAQQAELFAFEQDAHALFGNSVALSGDLALVGAPNAKVFLVEPKLQVDPPRGSFTMATRTGQTWQNAQEVADHNASEFGNSTCISGAFAFVGDPTDNVWGELSGAVHVYVRFGSTWQFAGKLSLGAPGVDTGFGRHVAASGNTLLVSSNNGVYFFDHPGGTTWSLKQTLHPLDYNPLVYTDFGAALSISGNTAIIGAPFDSNFNGTAAGAAYIFAQTGPGIAWSQQTKILGPNPGGVGKHNFGERVAISGDNALIGWPSQSRILFYHRTLGVWSKDEEFSQNILSELGAAIALSGDTALVGSPGEDSNAGHVRVLTRTGILAASPWVVKPLDQGAATGTRLGQTVALDGTLALVGAAALNGNGQPFVQSYENNGGAWSKENTLFSQEPSPNGFGQTLALMGHMGLIGSQPNSLLVNPTVNLYWHGLDLGSMCASDDACASYSCGCGDASCSFKACN